MGKQKKFEERFNRPDLFIQNSDGTKSTHRMVSGEVDGKYIAFPTIIDSSGTLVQKSFKDAFQYAMNNGEYKEFKTDAEAKAYANNGYKKGTKLELNEQLQRVSHLLNQQQVRNAIVSDKTKVKQAPIDIQSLLQPTIDATADYFNENNREIWSAYTMGDNLPKTQPTVEYDNKAGRNNAFYTMGTNKISFGEQEALNAFTNKDKTDSTGSNVYAHEYSHLLDGLNAVNPSFTDEFRKRYKATPVDVGILEHFLGGKNASEQSKNKYYKNITEMIARLNEIRVDAKKNRNTPYNYEYQYTDTLDIPKFSRVPNEYQGRLSGKDLIDLLNYWKTTIR